MQIETLLMPMARRIAALPYPTETKMKIAEFSGFAAGFVGGVVVFGGGYLAAKKIVTHIKSK